MTKIKICGITNLTDALDAIDAGANALGFVFYEKSNRYINPLEAYKIVQKLPPFIQTVGLFVNENANDIDKIMKQSKLDIAQIHFEATNDLYDNLQTKHIKVIRAKSKDDILKYPNDYKIVDAFVKQFGGEGKRLELSWFDNIDCSKIILAGGLNISNIKELKKFNFYGVDVSSGVEISKGKKDKNKMKQFCKEVYELSK